MLRDKPIFRLRTTGLLEFIKVKRYSACALIVAAVLTLGLAANAKDKKKPPVEVAPAAVSGFPDVYTKVVEKSERFETPAYFSLMASDGIRKVNAQALYGRLQAAVAANERYKALYLARVFTDLKPDVAASWTNRAQLASALGLADEVAACEQNAKDPTHLVKVPLAGILPGSALHTKPVSLADWAAATALLSDGIAEKEGKGALVAYKDLVSGIHVATPEEVAYRNNDRPANGLAPSGPWARAEPVQLRHVLANVFELRDAQPMKQNYGSKGGMAAALLVAGIAGTEQRTDPAASQQAWDLAQQTLGRSSQTPSDFKGGRYTRVTFENGKEVDSPDHPLTTGEVETVNQPFPFFWASGGSTEPNFSGSWESTEGVGARKFTLANLGELHNFGSPRHPIPAALHFPKLMTLCIRQPQTPWSCSIPLTLMELLLTQDDVVALAPDLLNTFVDLTTFSKAYDTPDLILEPGNSDKGSLVIWGGAQDGALYQLHWRAYSWLTGTQ